MKTPRFPRRQRGFVYRTWLMILAIVTAIILAVNFIASCADRGMCTKAQVAWIVDIVSNTAARMRDALTRALHDIDRGPPQPPPTPRPK